MYSRPQRKMVRRRRKAPRRIAVASLLLVLACGTFLVWHQKTSRSANSAAQTNIPGSSASNHKLTPPGGAANQPVASNSSSTSSTSPVSSEPLPSAKLLRVPAQSQLPQLPNGCEATSLSMLLTVVGHPVDKLTLAKDQPVDPTKRVYGAQGVTTYWGNPNVGFVGSVYEYANGFGIYHGPIAKFINQLLPARAQDLSGRPFSDLLAVVAHGTPVMVWTTATFQPTNLWTSWNTPEGPIKVTLQEHAVLLVGYNGTQLFVNNPLNGDQAQPVNRQEFIAAWKQLGEQAVTILPVAPSS